MRINVKTSGNGYGIIIENKAFSRLADLIGNFAHNKKVFVVTDDIVDSIYGTQLENQLGIFDIKKTVLPNGEKTKSIKYLHKLYNEFAEAGISRTDCIIAFGGGVIGDLTGFAAATFLRGVPFIQIPTTLLSQVDSSVGGKVAIDLEEGKNLVGSFYPPCLVVIDPALLSTLPERVFNDGMAEVIKYSAIRSKELFDILCGDISDKLVDIIAKCVNIKKQVVENDEFDTGERMILNFGHTFGHAVEKLYNYTSYTHGEGVAIGMLKITEKSEKAGITESGTTEKLRNLLKKYDLVFDDFVYDPADADKVIMLDKKGTKDTVKYIMITKIGEAIIKELPKTDKFLTEA